jgi:hypothetical protein
METFLDGSSKNLNRMVMATKLSYIRMLFYRNEVEAKLYSRAIDDRLQSCADYVVDAIAIEMKKRIEKILAVKKMKKLTERGETVRDKIINIALNESLDSVEKHLDPAVKFFCRYGIYGYKVEDDELISIHYKGIKENTPEVELL